MSDIERPITPTPMPGIVDTHCHILPGIDDGPDTTAAAVAMAKSAVDVGIDTIVATPHLRADFPLVDVHELAGRCAELRMLLIDEGIELALVSGAETSLSWALDASDEDLKMASFAQAGTDILLELPQEFVPQLEQRIHDLQARGYRLTLAHPERHRPFQRQPSLLRSLADQGVVLEINAEALLPKARRSASGRLAREVLKSGLMGVVASDAHSGYGHRSISAIAAAGAQLVQTTSAATAMALTTERPFHLVSGERLPELRREPSSLRARASLRRRRL
jgi:protein-tyrosine phosphatase